MSNVVTFQRHSLDKILDEVRTDGPQARGVVSIILKPNGTGHFRLSGFMSKSDFFTLLGLLDWVKADLLRDILDSAEPLE